MTFAAARTAGSGPTIETAHDTDWKTVPAKRESTFKTWIDSLEPSTNVEDRRGDLHEEEIAERYKEYVHKMDRMSEFDKADKSSRFENIPIPRPRPTSRMIKNKPLDIRPTMMGK